MGAIWRDDDIGARTTIAQLAAADDVFQRYGVTHTIAIMAEGMDRRPDLVEFIVERGMVAQLHCWQHDDLANSREARDMLAPAADMIERLFGARPTILYPTWNRVSPELEEVAAALGLRISAQKISLEQFIRFGGRVAENVVNFHHWHAPDVDQLDAALRIETGAQ